MPPKEASKTQLDQEEKIIVCVSERPCLFDKKNPGYKNKITRENNWTQVGEELQITGNLSV
jgi:hypothetical protein